MIAQPGRILTEVFEKEFPGFERKKELKPGYWFFQGPREEFYSALIITASRKYQCFEVDVYCGVFPEWDRQYGIHQLRSSTGLPNLRENSGMVDMRNIAYNHDRTESGIREALSTIVSEVRLHALPWFEERRKRRNTDFLMDHGLRWIDAKYDEVPSDIDSQLKAAFEKVGYVSWKVEHPLLKSLLHDLREFAFRKKVSKEIRADINVFALDLLRFAGLKKQSQQDGSLNSVKAPPPLR